MKCPRCESTLLTERERDGILVDVCAGCRGLWLDRGELEKLIARARDDLDEFPSRRDGPPSRVVRRYDDDSERHPKKPRRWIDALGDIFD